MDSAYASTFLGSLSTTEAAAVVRDRLQVNRNVHEELADWFKEWQALQQNYGRALLRLSERRLKLDLADLGVAEPTWRRIVEATLLGAREYIKAGDKVQEEVVRYLANWEATTDTANVSSLERELSALAKSIEQAESKQSKAGTSRFGNKASKQAEAEQELSQAKARWSAEAPRVFENLQKLDERRVATFKDAMVRWQTSQIDLSTNLNRQSELTIAQLLELNPTDETMHVITARLAQGTMVPGVSPQQAQQQQQQQPASRGSLSAPSLNRRTSQADETGSVRSSGGTGSSLKSKFGTLLRGKRSTSPSKRKSGLPGLGSSSGSNGTQRAIPPPVQEEPTEQFEPTPTTTAAQPTPVQPTAAPVHSQPVSPITSDVVMPRAIAEPRTTTLNDLDDLNFGSTPESANFHTAPRESVSAENDDALNSVSSSLRAQNTISRRSGGRRDSRNLFGTNGSAQEQANGSAVEKRDVVRDVLGSPVRENVAPFSSSSPIVAVPQTRLMSPVQQTSSFGGDSDSIRSGRSNASSSTGLAGSRHAEPATDGVHISILETVLFTSSTVATISGEVAVAVRNPTDNAALQLRLQSPQGVNRLIANTQVLDRRSDDEYLLQPQTTPRMTALFKYQVDAEEARPDRFKPVAIEQKWTTEANQTSVKLTLKLNTGFGASSVTLQDLEVHVSLSGQANSCVAKPSGTFIKSGSKLVWRLGQATFDHTTATNLLARFKTTELAGPAETIELRWRTQPSTLALGSGLAVLATKQALNPFGDDSLAAASAMSNVLVQHSYVVQSTKQLFPTVSA